MALNKRKHHMSNPYTYNMYIEVYESSEKDFVNVAGGNNKEAQAALLTKGAQVIVRMRGLPYDCTAKQVTEFFESGNEESSCKVMDGEGGVLFVEKPDGKPTGDAFVLFASEEDLTKALSKHRKSIGTRYIELFRSNAAEVQQVFRLMESQSPPLPIISYLPQRIITSGTREDCIRLRGLPYEASVEHILVFLDEYAKNIVLQGVHMVFNSQGRPSGEAFIQMDSETSAYAASTMRHKRYMYFGKKQRYIEVFQCSGEDMNHVLCGGISKPTATVAPVSPFGKTLLSPGMLNTPPLLPPAANATAAAAASVFLPPANPAVAFVPPGAPLAAAGWDPILAHVLQMQQQAAVFTQAQAQATYRSQQENVWLQHLMAQQQQQRQHHHHHQQQLQEQMQLAAFAQKTATWSELNGTVAGNALLSRLPTGSSIVPNPVSVTSAITSHAVASTTGSTAAKHKSILPPLMFPGVSPVVATSGAASSQQPFVLINIPRIASSIQSPYSMAASKIAGVTSTSTVNQAAIPTVAVYNMPQNPSLITHNPQYSATASSVLKRSWEHAFQDNIVAMTAAGVKRPYPMLAPGTGAAATPLFTIPPPQTTGTTTSAQFFAPS